MSKYRITTVSGLDGKPTTKLFDSQAAADQVWSSITNRGTANYAFGLYARMGQSQYGDCFIREVIATFTKIKAEEG